MIHVCLCCLYPILLQALGEGGDTSLRNPTVRLRLPATSQDRGSSEGGGGRVHSLVVSPAQLAVLHSAVIG